MAFSFVGSATGAGSNGASITVTLPSLTAGDRIVVFTMASAGGAVNQTVTSSTGAVYAAIFAPVQNTVGNAFLAGRHRTALSTGEVTITCSGSGNATDVTLAAAYVFRDTNRSSALSVTSTSTTATGTTPDSPAITSESSSSVIISAFGAPLVDATVTAPSSYLNAISTTATDTISGTIAAAWVTAGASGSFNPTAWSGLTSAAWIAASVSLTPVSFSWSAPTQFEGTGTGTGARKPSRIGY